MQGYCEKVNTFFNDKFFVCISDGNLQFYRDSSKSKLVDSVVLNNKTTIHESDDRTLKLTNILLESGGSLPKFSVKFDDQQIRNEWKKAIEEACRPTAAAAATLREAEVVTINETLLSKCLFFGSWHRRSFQLIAAGAGRFYLERKDGEKLRCVSVVTAETRAVHKPAGKYHCIEITSLQPNLSYVLKTDDETKAIHIQNAINQAAAVAAAAAAAAAAEAEAAAAAEAAAEAAMGSRHSL
jgi:hypothetical protein